MSDAKLIACSISSAGGFINATIALLGGHRGESAAAISLVSGIFFLIPALREILGSFAWKDVKAFLTGKASD